MKISTSAQKKGADAGSMFLHFKDRGAFIEITGSHSENLSPSNPLQLTARGGNGVDGHIGADGHAGRNGRDGADATRYSRGGDGEDGGRGGHGEAGTNGTDSGSGGNIEVFFQAGDEALLDMITLADTSAGTPGRAGRHGQGGRGGRGGRGGSSYNWTEYEGYDSVEHYTDANGNSHSRMVRRLRPVYHSNPGGSDGRRGPDGGSYTHRLYPGKSGEHGQYTIHVGESCYHEPFRLKLSPVAFVGQEGHGIYEPGDRIHASYQLKNDSQQMKSPREDALICLYRNEDINSKTNQGMIEGNIEPGESKNTAPEVTFQLRLQNVNAVQNAFQKTITIHAIAWNTRLGKAFQGTDSEHSLTLQYPVKIQSRVHAYSIAEGESQRLTARVQNISSKALGHKSHEKGRRVRLSFFDGTMETASKIYQIETLNAGEILSLPYEFRFPEGTELGQQHICTAGLYLEPISRNNRLKLIQIQRFTLQLTATYQPPKLNGFTLLINVGTPQTTIKYWQQRLKELSGEDISIYNASYYKRHPYQKLLSEAPNGSLIVLDNNYHSSETRRVKSSLYLKKTDIIHANRQSNTGIIVIGNQSEIPKLSPSTRPPKLPDYIRLEHHSENELIQYLLNRRWQPNAATIHRLNLPASHWFYGQFDIDAQLSSLNQTLQAVFPNRLYHIRRHKTTTIHRFTIEYIGSRYSLYNHTTIPENDAGFIKNIINPLPFKQKIQLLLTSSSKHIPHLKNAIIEDLFFEQQQLSQTLLYGSFWQRLLRYFSHDFQAELTLLPQLTNHLEKMKLNSSHSVNIAYADSLIEIIARLKYQMELQCSFWLTLLNFFIPQTSVLLYQANRALLNQYVNVHAEFTEQEVKEVNENIERKQSILAFQTKLEQFINENSVTRSYFHFFSKEKLPDADLKILNWLHGLGCEKVSETLLINHYRQLTMPQARATYQKYLSIAGISLPEKPEVMVQHSRVTVG